MTAPERVTLNESGTVVVLPNFNVWPSDVEYTRSDLCIRRDDPVLVQVIEALSRIGNYCREENCISQGEINCGVWARSALAALQELSGGKDA